MYHIRRFPRSAVAVGVYAVRLDRLRFEGGIFERGREDEPALIGQDRLPAEEAGHGHRRRGAIERPRGRRRPVSSEPTHQCMLQETRLRFMLPVVLTGFEGEST